MAFVYPAGGTGITVNGMDLQQFSAKLLSGYQPGATALTTDTFQGASRSTVLLLSQEFGALELVLPLEFWGLSRRDTMEKWSRFCQAMSGPVELDLKDGYIYAGCATDFGTPAWIRDGWMAVDVKFRAMRQKPEITVSTETNFGAGIICESTFPRTDCIIRVPSALLGGAKLVSVRLGENEWFLSANFPSKAELVLDGVQKIFTMNGKNVTAQMEWEDFPYLVPGENSVALFIDTAGFTRGMELRYRPTFL